jgi:hypothetical protein
MRVPQATAPLVHHSLAGDIQPGHRQAASRARVRGAGTEGGATMTLDEFMPFLVARINEAAKAGNKGECVRLLNVGIDSLTDARDKLLLEMAKETPDHD